MAGVPYFRLSGFYFFYFATLGALLPYWSLYLREQGYSAAQIGTVFGVMLGTKVIAPYVWGWLADRRGRRVSIIRLAALLTLAVFTVIPYTGTFAWLLLFMTIYGFFWNAALPQVEVVTFNHLGTREERYGHIRLWGSIGFIVSVITLGWILERYGLSPLPLWIIAALGGVFAVTLLLDESPVETHHEHHHGLVQVLKRPEVFSLLLACLLMQLSHGPYYTFFSIYLEDHGYARGHIGLLWSLGVVAEVGVFLAMPILVRHLGMRRLFLGAILVTVIRWVLLAGFVDSPVVIVIVQLMHLASFGLYHAVAVNLIHRFFKGRLQGRGQALYSSMSFGVGGGLGSLLSGFFWDLTSPTVIYASAGGVAAAAWLLCWWLLRVEHDRIGTEKPAIGTVA